MLPRPEGHPGGNQYAANLRPASLPRPPGRSVRKDFELPPDGQRSARACRIAGPDVRGQFRRTASKPGDELFRQALFTIGLNFERFGIRPGDKDDVCGPEKPQSLGPGVFPLDGAQAGPAKQNRGCPGSAGKPETRGGRLGGRSTRHSRAARSSCSSRTGDWLQLRKARVGQEAARFLRCRALFPRGVSKPVFPSGEFRNGSRKCETGNPAMRQTADW